MADFSDLPPDRRKEIEKLINDLMQNRIEISKEEFDIQQQIHDIRKEVAEQYDDYESRAEKINTLREKEIEKFEDQVYFFETLIKKSTELEAEEKKVRNRIEEINDKLQEGELNIKEHGRMLTELHDK